MNRPYLSSTVVRLLAGAACVLSSVSCGGELLRTGRSPVYLVVTNMSASASGGGTTSSFLLSDVQVLVEETVGGVTVQIPTTTNDNATATITVNPKNPDVATTAMNSVTLTRYHVDFRRTDGRNTPGVDVPYGIDGGLGVTISPNQPAQVAFEIIRHQAKLEPPLRQLRGFGGLVLISTIAEITFYGRDQNGNELTVTTRMDVQFGDFADE
jgi:hypothetical protein